MKFTKTTTIKDIEKYLTICKIKYFINKLKNFN